MPLEQVHIARFDGLVGSEDLEDAPPGGMRYVNGVDPRPHLADFRGLPSDGSLGGVWTNGVSHIKAFRKGNEAVIIASDNNIFHVTSLDGTPVAGGTLGSPTGLVGGLSSDGLAVHIAKGRTNEPQWVGDAGTGVDLFSAVIKRPTTAQGFIIAATLGTQIDGGFFKNTAAYYYRISVVYDGNQESPLGDLEDFKVLTDDYDDIDVVITRPAAKPNGRETHVKIYRAEAGTTATLGQIIRLGEGQRGGVSPGGGSSRDPDRSRGGTGPRAVLTVDPGAKSEFTLVEQIKWDDFTGTPKIYTLEDEGRAGPGFATESGLSQTLSTMEVSYDLCLRVGDYNVIAGMDILSEDDPESEYQVLWSKPNRFDTFNWPYDWEPLEYKVVTMAFWLDRVWLFTAGSAFVLNEPPRMGTPRLEGGIGAESLHSVATSRFGMIVCGAENISYHNRAVFSVISGPIEELLDDSGTDVGYNARTGVASAGYAPSVGLFIVSYSTGGGPLDNHMLFYHPPSGRWSHAVAPSGTVASRPIFTTPAGKVYLWFSNNLYHILKGPTERIWTAITRWFTGGAFPVMPLEAVFIGDAPVVTLYEDEVAGTSVSLSADGFGHNKGTINSSPGAASGAAWGIVRRFSLKFVGTPTDKRLESVFIRWRRMRSE